MFCVDYVDNVCFNKFSSLFWPELLCVIFELLCLFIDTKEFGSWLTFMSECSCYLLAKNKNSKVMM